MEAKDFLEEIDYYNTNVEGELYEELGIETLADILEVYHQRKLKLLGIGAVSGSFLFDKSLLEKATIKQPEYVMGVDTYDKDALAYCFGRKVDGVFEIMLSKTMRDKNEFKQEVENLAKYFNADVFRSGE